MKRLSWLLLAAALFFQTGAFAPPAAQAALAAMPGQNIVCVTSGKTQICASVSVRNPAQYTYVTVYGRLKVNGVLQKSKIMRTAWHYRTTTSNCQGTTGITSLASCTRYISRATKGYKVLVVVTINGYSVTTWFTPG